MARKEIVLEALERRIQEYEKYRKFEDIEELNEFTKTTLSQIQTAREVNLINTIIANEYLSRIEARYSRMIQESRFKEYREQVVNFNDDLVTARERLLKIQKNEKDNARQCMKSWEMTLSKKSGNHSGGNKERADRNKDKEEERWEVKKNDETTVY